MVVWAAEGRGAGLRCAQDARAAREAASAWTRAHAQAKLADDSRVWRACDVGGSAGMGTGGPHGGSVVHTVLRLTASMWYPMECTQKQWGQQRAMRAAAAHGSVPVRVLSSRA